MVARRVADGPPMAGSLIVWLDVLWLRDAPTSGHDW